MYFLLDFIYLRILPTLVFISFSLLYCGVLYCGVLCCVVVWCVVVWYGVVWYGMVWCVVLCCGVVWCGVMPWCLFVCLLACLLACFSAYMIDPSVICFHNTCFLYLRSEHLYFVWSGESWRSLHSFLQYIDDDCYWSCVFFMLFSLFLFV